MPTIEAKTGIVTHINVFTVPKEMQQRLVDQLIETVNAAKQVPGWIFGQHSPQSRRHPCRQLRAI
jgi:hypothetical protein